MAALSATVPRHILLIVTGGIAAYKALELVRLLRRAGHAVTAVLTSSGSRFVTALSLQALSGNRFLCGIGPSGPQVVEGWHGVDQLGEVDGIGPGRLEKLRPLVRV